MSFTSRPNDTFRKTQKYKKKHHPVKQKQNKTLYPTHTRNEDCNPLQCLGNKLMFITSSFRAENIRKHHTHTLSSAQWQNSPN